MDTPTYTGLQAQILDLLGNGLNASVVSAAVGVTESYVSQLMAQEDFRGEVRKRRIESLKEVTELDSEYHNIEKAAVEKLKKLMPLINRPRDILDTIKVINATKRRGQDSSEPTERSMSRIIEVRMPVNILNQFIDSSAIVKDTNNQIIRTGNQSLLTAQPQNVRELARTIKEPNDTARKAASPGSNTEKITGRPKSLCLEDLE